MRHLCLHCQQGLPVDASLCNLRVKLLRVSLISMVNNYRLIFEVSKHEELFNSKHKYYFDVDNRNNIWSEIAKTLDCSAEMCKSRWRNLRTSFVNEFKKSQDGENRGRKWMYYEQMVFILPYIHNRRNHRDHQNIDRRSDNDYEMDQSESSAVIEDSKEFIELTEDFIDPLESAKDDSDSNICIAQPATCQNPETDTDDSLKLFFLAMYKTVKSFPPRMQIAAKKIIFNEVTTIEENLHGN